MSAVGSPEELAKIQKLNDDKAVAEATAQVMRILNTAQEILDMLKAKEFTVLDCQNTLMQVMDSIKRATENNKITSLEIKGKTFKDGQIKTV